MRIGCRESGWLRRTGWRAAHKCGRERDLIEGASEQIRGRRVMRDGITSRHARAFRTERRPRKADPRRPRRAAHALVPFLTDTWRDLEAPGDVPRVEQPPCRILIAHRETRRRAKDGLCD